MISSGSPRFGAGRAATLVPASRSGSVERSGSCSVMIDFLAFRLPHASGLGGGQLACHRECFGCHRSAGRILHTQHKKIHVVEPGGDIGPPCALATLVANDDVDDAV